MTGRKVTRRASMRRKSMRSPSVSRSSGSKTPRSVASEPNTSGMNSFNDSAEKLNGREEVIELVTATEVVEDVAATKVVNDRISYADVASPAVSSSELLATELAAIKITDSKENLVQEETKEVSATQSDSGTDEFVSAAEESVSAVDEYAPVIDESVSSPLSQVNKSSSSLNKLTRTNSKLNMNSEEAVKSTEELVPVALDEQKDVEEPVESKQQEGETMAEEAASVGAVESAPVDIEGEEKKCAKCRCIIS